MKLIIAVLRSFKVSELVDAVEADPRFPGITVLSSRGFGREKTAPHQHSPEEDVTDFVDNQTILIAVPDRQADDIVRRIEAVARTRQPGDGKVFVVPLTEAVRIASGERGEAALE